MDLVKNLIRVGRVSAVFPEHCTARVVFEDRANLISYELPTLGRGSLSTKDYWLPDVDEQVVCLFLPNGNAQGFIIGSPFSKVDPPPVNDPDKRHIAFSDGTFIEYDRSTHTLFLDAKGPINIVTSNQVTISAEAGVNVVGDLTVSGSISADGDVTAGGISLRSHVHSGVQSGPSNTDPPVE
jgi:phage baseplate assembly protein V